MAPENKAGTKQVKEIRIGASDNLRNIWNRLLATEDIGDTVRYKEGPALSIFSTKGLKINEISVQTEEPNRATETLTKAGMTQIEDQRLRIGSLEIMID